MIYNNIASKYLRIQNYINWRQLKITEKKDVKPAIYSCFRPVWTYNIEKITQYCLNIKYADPKNKLDSLMIQLNSIYLIPQYKQQLLYSTISSLNYFNATSISLKQTLKLNKYKIIYYSELSHFGGDQNYLSPWQKLFRIEKDTAKGYSKEVLTLPLKFGKINLEYHIPFLRSNTVFYFVDYSRYTNSHDILWDYNPHCAQYKYQLDSKYYNLLSCGLGLQMIVPIQHIPPLRLEYSYKTNNVHSFHLKVYKYTIDK